MDDTPGWVEPSPPPDPVPPRPPAQPAQPADPAVPAGQGQAPRQLPALDYFSSPEPRAPAPGSWAAPSPPAGPGSWGAPAPPPPAGPGTSWGPPPPPPPPPYAQYPQYGQPPGQYQQYSQYPQYGGQYQQYGQYTPPPWGGYAPEYKPGVVPLRPLAVGEVLDGSFSTIRKNPRIVFGFAAVLAIIAELIRLGIGLALNNVPASLGSSSFSTSTDNTSTDTTTTTNSGSITAVVVSLIVSALCVAVLSGVVTGVVGKAVIGQQPDSHEILATVRKRWFGLLVVSVLAEILPFTPFLLIVIGVVLGAISTGLGITFGVLGGVAALVLGPLLWGRLALAVPIFILERRGPGASIARSWRLVRGAFWRTWGLRALVWVIVSIASGVLSLPLVFVLAASTSDGKTPSVVVLIVAAI
ncbi:MAG TPA: hypothetical protein VK662_00020, partial [Acidothermaceae bacterium]|nr:hypothetical protein [Acidothermaceae bacterium]